LLLTATNYYFRPSK